MTKVHTVTVLPGDGIGPEIESATLRVLSATGVAFNWDNQLIGEAAERQLKNGLPEQTLESIRRNKVALKGPTGTPSGSGHRSYNVALREEFELFSNVRLFKSLPGVGKRYADTPIDLVLFRENLEDLYVGEERKIDGGAEAVSRITYAGSAAIAGAAFEYAHLHGRKKVTVGVKDNILKLTHGEVFYGAVRAIAAVYPTITFQHLIADNFGMQLVKNPSWFDVVILPNFLGDIFSDIMAGIVHESLGFAGGANIGEEYAVFEAVHGTAPDIAGKGIANPSALILSGAMMLDHLGEVEAAQRVRSAIEQTLRDGIYTGDVHREGAVNTATYTQAVIERL